MSQSPICLLRTCAWHADAQVRGVDMDMLDGWNCDEHRHGENMMDVTYRNGGPART